MSYPEGYNAAKRMVLKLHHQGAVLYEYDSEKSTEEFTKVVDDRLCSECTHDWPCATAQLFDATPKEIRAGDGA